MIEHNSCCHRQRYVADRQADPEADIAHHQSSTRVNTELLERLLILMDRAHGDEAHERNDALGNADRPKICRIDRFRVHEL